MSGPEYRFHICPKGWVRPWVIAEAFRPVPLVLKDDDDDDDDDAVVVQSPQGSS